jgi:hypothetical protein
MTPLAKSVARRPSALSTRGWVRIMHLLAVLLIAAVALPAQGMFRTIQGTGSFHAFPYNPCSAPAPILDNDISIAGLAAPGGTLVVGVPSWSFLGYFPWQTVDRHDTYLLMSCDVAPELYSAAETGTDDTLILSRNAVFVSLADTAGMDTHMYSLQIPPLLHGFSLYFQAVRQWTYRNSSTTVLSASTVAYVDIP